MSGSSRSEFDVPASGGVRLMLVGDRRRPAATAAGDARPPAAAAGAAGNVSLGDQTRFVFEMADGALTGFYILQMVNMRRTPVQPATPLTIELPDGRRRRLDHAGLVAAGTWPGRKVVVRALRAGPDPGAGRLLAAVRRRRR